MGIHHSIIRHPDLTKMSEQQLQVERDRLENQYAEILERIRRTRMMIGMRLPINTPSWQLITDLGNSQERWEAILEEQEYRKLP